MANKEKNITDTISNINTTLDGALKEGLKKIDIPSVGKSILGTPAKVVDGVLLTDKVAKAPTEKGKFTEVYKWSAGTAGSAGGAVLGAKGGAMIGAALGSVVPIIGTTIGATAGAIGGAATGAYFGNKGGESLAESTANKAYSLYTSTKEKITSSDSNPNIPILSNSFLTLFVTPNNYPNDSNDSSSTSSFTSTSSFDSTSTSIPTTSPIPFKITKAHIKESLEELFAVECEGYIESMQEQLISFSQNTLNLHPKSLIDTLATFTITNPYNNNTLNFMDSADKSYKGILSAINYLGLNQESSKQLLESFYLHSFLQKAS